MMEALISCLNAWADNRDRVLLMRAKDAADLAVQSALESGSADAMQRCSQRYRQLSERACALGSIEVWRQIKFGEVTTDYELGSTHADLGALFRSVTGIDAMLDHDEAGLDPDQIASLERMKGHALAEIGHLEEDAEALREAIASYEASLAHTAKCEPSTLVRLTQLNIQRCRDALAGERGA